MCGTYVIVCVSQPAAWILLWTPAAGVWTAPPPICNTEHRGGSATAGPGPPGPSKQVNGTFMEKILPSLIVLCLWQWVSHPFPPRFQSFVSFLLCTAVFTAPLPQITNCRENGISSLSKHRSWIVWLMAHECSCAVTAWEEGGVSALHPEFLHVICVFNHNISGVEYQLPTSHWLLIHDVTQRCLKINANVSAWRSSD